MNSEAWNKIIQTHCLFKKIISPLKQHLNISFGYMIVFNEAHYYAIQDDINCLQTYINNVDTSHIFCARNVTNSNDGDYHFTLWPEMPTCDAMDIYYKFNVWNGITVTKLNKNYAELYWFNRNQYSADWHKFFIRNKHILMEFINYFNLHKNQLLIPSQRNVLEMFKFNGGFNTNISKSSYEEEFNHIKNLKKILNSASKPTTLSSREIQILELFCNGYSYKSIAINLSISTKTVSYHIESIKNKIHSRFRPDLIKFYKELY